MTDHDVVIVGAGPAGSHLAIRMARAGHSVALLDRRRFPRPKPCGEFMSPECLPMLDALGMREAVLDRGARRVRGMDLHGYGRTSRGRYGTVGSARAPFDHGYAVRREVLDALAVDVARTTPGVDVFEGCCVDGLIRSPDGGIRGVFGRGPDQSPFALRARFTIGADGLRSRVASELGVRRDIPWLAKFAFVARYHGVPAQDHAEVHFVPGGYLAVCPVDDDLFTLNLVVDRTALPNGRSDMPRFLAERIAQAPELAAKLGGREPTGEIRACGPLAGRTTAQTFDGAALVGDACGYVDPVTGEGLFYAMRGAELLATDLIAALSQNRTDRAALRTYTRSRRREFAPRLFMARLLQRGMRHPRIVHAVLALLEARPRLTDLIVSMTGDYVPPRELMRPSVWWSALRAGGAR